MFTIVAAVLFAIDTWEALPLAAGVVAFFGSLNLFAIGIASQYLSKAYLETKGRPLYIAKEKT